MLYFEFKRKKDKTLKIMDETFVNNMRKAGTAFWRNIQIEVITPLTELKKGAILRFRYNEDYDFIPEEMELVGCYVDLETHKLYTELGLEMPFKRIF